MQIDIARNALAQALGLVDAVVEKKTTIPILGHVRLAIGGGVSVEGTNLDTWMRSDVLGAAGPEGEITLPATRLRDIVKALPDGADMRIVVDDNRARITSGRSRFTLPVLPAADFPAEPADDMPVSFQMPALDLRALLQSVTYAIGNSADSPQLNGAWIAARARDGGHELVATATDRHRLARRIVPAPAGAERLRPLGLTADAVDKLLRMIGPDDGMAAIDAGASRVRVTIAGKRAALPQLQGEMWEFDRIIPKDTPHAVDVDRKELAGAIARARAVIDGLSAGIKLTLQDDGIAIDGASADRTADAAEHVHGTIDGPPLVYGVSAAYLADAVANTDAEVVRLRTAGQTAPLVLTGIGRDDVMHLIMPMRV